MLASRSLGRDAPLLREGSLSLDTVELDASGTAPAKGCSSGNHNFSIILTEQGWNMYQRLPVMWLLSVRHRPHFDATVGNRCRA